MPREEPKQSNHFPMKSVLTDADPDLQIYEVVSFALL